MARVRRGIALRAVAREARVSLSTVQRWVTRAGDRRLERVDWGDRPAAPLQPARTAAATEDLVLELRRELKASSVLGEYGAVAIQEALRERGVASRPSVRTIGRILERRGALDYRRRGRHPPPPRGWYLPAVATRTVELDSFDIVQGLVIAGRGEVEVLTGMSLHGGVPGAWPRRAVTAPQVVECLLSHWQQLGTPGYAQFDNDTRFQGAHQCRDSFGRVMRLCLSLQVVPVFAPVREPGFQAAIEHFNGRWQQVVWRRFRHPSHAALVDRSDQYVGARRCRAAGRAEAAPVRPRIPPGWHFDVHTPLRGHVIYLRRTSERGTVRFLGHTFEIDPLWSHRLVRCDIDLDVGRIQFFALRRRDPWHQPLLREVAYEPPRRRFQG